MKSFRSYVLAGAVAALGVSSQTLHAADLVQSQSPVNSYTQTEHDYYSVDKVEIAEVPLSQTSLIPLPGISPAPSPSPGPSASPNPLPCGILGCGTTTPGTGGIGGIGGVIGSINSVITTVGNIVAVGEKIWAIIEAGKPTAQVLTNSVSALPKDFTHWTQMTNWQGPILKKYHVSATNKLGMKVVEFDYSVMTYFGGESQGKGQYLTNLTMVSDNLTVLWGYSIAATAELSDLVNTSSADSPIPGCTLSMKLKIDSVFQHSESTHAIFVKGDGSVKELN